MTLKVRASGIATTAVIQCVFARTRIFTANTGMNRHNHGLADGRLLSDPDGRASISLYQGGPVTLLQRLFQLLFPLIIAACSTGVASVGDDPHTLLSLLRVEVLNESLADRDVYVSGAPLSGGEEVHSWRSIYTVPREFAQAWLFFIDDAPGANWEHPCRYVFVDIVTRRHVVISARTPPTDLTRMRRLDNGR